MRVYKLGVMKNRFHLKNGEKGIARTVVGQCVFQTKLFLKVRF